MNDREVDVSANVPEANSLAALADSLHTAEQNLHPIPPLTDRIAGLSLNDAYRIQQMNIERRIASGEILVGHKIGLTARAMQEKFGVSEPDYGQLLESMMHPGQKPLDMSSLIDPQIEIEPAFVLGRQLTGPNVTIEDVLAATDYVVVCFEVIDSRIIDWQIQLPDTVADNGSSARVILGPEKIDPYDLDLKDMETVLEVDGVIVETGNTGDILGHPATAIAWLANTIHEYGVVLEAGHVVLPGTCTACYRIGGHRSASGRIDGLGSISIKLEGQPAVENNT